MPRGRGGGRGGRRGGGGHKGQRRHFTNEEELQQAEHKKEKEKEWRRQRGLPSESESGSGSEDEHESRPAAAAAAKSRPSRVVQPGDLPPSSSEEYSSDDEEAKPKGVSHLIEVQNPNHMKKKDNRKVSELGNDESKPQLSRREREELEKQAAAERYKKMHLAGKTDEARADLARLQIIKQQREEAAKRRDEERRAAELAAAERKAKAQGK